MPRPRKDGKPTVPAVRIGKERQQASGKPWRVRAYAPTPAAPYGKITYIKPDTGRLSSAVPTADQTLDEKFEQVELWLDQGVALGVVTNVEGAIVRRDIHTLGPIYLTYLVLKQRDESYVANRKSILNKWIYPVIGSVLVADWGPEDSERVIKNARGKVSAKRLQDIGSVLSGLRAAAHRRRAGGRWLSPDEDPLEEVEYGRSIGRQGASSKWVAPHKRPETTMVEKAIVAAGECGRWDWLPDAINVSAFCAPRQAEMLGARAIDLDFDFRELDINGVWYTPPSGQRAGQGKVRAGRRKPYPKNGQRRTTPFLGSQTEMLRRRAAAALGLAADTTIEMLRVHIEAERDRRAKLTDTGDWRDAHVDPEHEPWLFPSEDGLPPSKEQFNDAWHVVRDAIGWTRTIPYRNLRHHAILWWQANVAGIQWDTIADWSGHDVRTLHAYYVIPSEDATKRARAGLDAL